MHHALLARARNVAGGTVCKSKILKFSSEFDLYQTAATELARVVAASFLSRSVGRYRMLNAALAEAAQALISLARLWPSLQRAVARFALIARSRTTTKSKSRIRDLRSLAFAMWTGLRRAVVRFAILAVAMPAHSRFKFFFFRFLFFVSSSVQATRRRQRRGGGGYGARMADPLPLMDRAHPLIS
jgi:hypothetical protein